MKDFWLSCGHHLLDRDHHGKLCVTDEFMKVYLARPELAPPPEACAIERGLHAALISDPWQPVATSDIAAIAEADARENWQYMIEFRDHLAAHHTLEAAYLALVQQGVRIPPIFLNQVVQLILRNALDECDDPFMLRAAELFFRPQRMTVHEGSLLAADEEQIDGNAAPVSPLASMLGLPTEPAIEVLNDENAPQYWQRSDRFDLALDLTSGRRGLVALGTVIRRWLKHLIDIDVDIEQLNALRDVKLSWYVGLDADATKIGDALWHDAEIDDAARQRVAGLFQLTFRDPGVVVERMKGEAVYLILAMSPDRILRMKPQNLLTGLPMRQMEKVS
jgi:hypothetical protein